MIENYAIWETHTKEAEKLKKKNYVLLLVLINQTRIIFNASKVNTYSSL